MNRLSQRQRRWIIASLGCLIAVGWWSLTQGSADAAASNDTLPAIGAVVDAGAITFKDQWFLSRSLMDLEPAEIKVVVAVTEFCPLVKRYAPKLEMLFRTYRDRQVSMLALYVGPEASVPRMAAHALEFGLTFPIGRDAEGVAAAALGLTRTPQVVVLNRENRIVYRGRIDDQYRVGGERPHMRTDDLRDAIEALLAGRAIANPETPADGCRITRPVALRLNPAPTYHGHIRPILQAHCVECHRNGGDAPFPLTTVGDARQHAETIAEVVAEERMPPWFADPRHTEFVNRRGLDPEEKSLLIAWCRGDRALGTPRESVEPSVPRSSEVVKTNDAESNSKPGNWTWRIGTPDLVIVQPFAHQLPATGFIDYKYVVFPYLFTHETWVDHVEITSDNPTVLHHANLACVPLGRKFEQEFFITGKVPGGDPMRLDPGIAYKIPAGSVLAIQIHYTTTGKPETCRLAIGLKYPRVKVQRQLHHQQVTTGRFLIPPGEPAHVVQSTRTIPFDAEGLGMFSHMHLRGKNMIFDALSPEGRRERLLVVPNYHFEWQQPYRWRPGTKRFPAGTVLEVTAQFDNSAFNPFNPDPSRAVGYGDQTYDEMMFGFVFYTRADEALDLTIDPKTGRVVWDPR